MAIKTVRDAIADHLSYECISFEGFYQPGIANQSTPAPFGVIKVTGDRPDGPVRIKGVQVAVHTRDTDDLCDLDSLCYEVEKALDLVDVDCGEDTWLTPEYTGTTSEFPDEDRGTIMKLVEFEIGTGR